MLLKKLRKKPFEDFEKGVVPEGQVINTNNTNCGIVMVIDPVFLSDTLWWLG